MTLSSHAMKTSPEAFHIILGYGDAVLHIPPRLLIPSQQPSASAEIKGWAALRFTPGTWRGEPSALPQEQTQEAPSTLPTLCTVHRHPSIQGAMHLMQWLAPRGHMIRVTTEKLYKKGLEFPQHLTRLSMIQTSVSSFPR